MFQIYFDSSSPQITTTIIRISHDCMKKVHVPIIAIMALSYLGIKGNNNNNIYLQFYLHENTYTIYNIKETIANLEEESLFQHYYVCHAITSSITCLLLYGCCILTMYKHKFDV